MASRHGIAEIATGAGVLAVAVAFLGYAVARTGQSAQSGYPLTAKFERIDGLALGADVRIAGVRVGSVDRAQVDPDTFQAVVGLTLRDDIKIPKDSSAEIVSESLLGGKYVSLTPGGDTAVLKPGQSIAVTVSSVSLEQLLGKFVFGLTNLGKPAEGAPK